MYTKIIQRMRMVVRLAVAAPWRRFAWRAILAMVLGGLASTAQADYSNTVASFNPLGYWRLNETGATADPNIATNNGTAGSSLNGTYQNSGTRGVTGALVGDSDTAVSFSSGSSQAMSVPYSSSLNPSGDFTYEIWGYPTSGAAYKALCSSGNFFNSGNRQGFIIYEGGSNWSVRLYSGSGTSFTELLVPLDLNAWQHLALVRSGTTISAYKNGVFQTSTTNAMNAPTAGSYTAVGARWIGDSSSLANYFDGKADEFAIYNTALSAGDLLAHYDNGTNSARSTPYQTLVGNSSPVGYYRLNEPAFIYPTAVNSGSLGSAADGTYSAGTFTAQAGPPSMPGLGASNVACLFNGSGQINCGNNTGLDLTNISIAAWIKPGVLFNNMNILAKGGSLWHLQIDGFSNHLKWFCPGGGVTGIVTGAKNVTDGLWHHVVAVAGTNGSALYVDGALDASDATSVTSLPTNTDPVTIGSQSDPILYRWNGNLDEVALFGTALTPSNAVALYLAAEPPTKDIISFGPGAMISGTNITWKQPAGTIVTNLSPTFTISFQATCDKASGSIQNFSNPVTYTVTAPDASSKTYSVTVELVPLANTIVGDWSFLNSTNPGWATARTVTLTPGGIQLGTQSVGEGWIEHDASAGMSYTNSGFEMLYTGAPSPDDHGDYHMYLIMVTWENTFGSNLRQGFVIDATGSDTHGETKQMFADGNYNNVAWQSQPANVVGRHTMALVRLADGTVNTYVDRVLKGTQASVDPNVPLTKIGVGDQYTGNWYIPRGTVVERVRAFTFASQGFNTNDLLTTNLPPEASFSASPTNGPAPLAVSFTDTSTPHSGAITNRYWTFGDGGTTNIVGTNVTYTYSSTGTFTVALTDYDNAGGSGSITQSNFIVVTTLPPPSGLMALALNERVKLTWSNAVGATGYVLSRAMTSNGTPNAIFTTSATTYLNTGLTNGTEYWYAVAATNNFGPGGNSAWVPATPQAPTSPAFLPGSGVSVNVGTGAATLTFTASDGWQYQIVYKDDLLSGVWTAVPPGWQTASSNGTMTVTDPNATNSPQRFYRVEIR